MAAVRRQPGQDQLTFETCLVSRPPSHNVSHICASSSAARVATAAADGVVCLWMVQGVSADSTTQPSLLPLSLGCFHQAPIAGITFVRSQEGDDVLMSVCDDGSAALWRAEDGRCVCTAAQRLR